MLEPVKPLTTLDAQLRRARAVFFSSSAARASTPAACPPPTRAAGRIDFAGIDDVQHRLPDQVRADGVQLQVVTFQQVAASGAIASFSEHLSTSKWSPQQASSSP